MNFNHIDQLIEGIDCHYILINLYEVDAHIHNINIKELALKFLNSNEFSTSYVAKTKDKNRLNGYLPFAFNISSLEQEDFKISSLSPKETIVNNLRKEFISDNIDVDDEFYFNFVKMLNVLMDYTSSLTISNTFCHINIYDYEHTSSKITERYNEMGYTVDYFYFGIIFTFDSNQFITFETAYE